MIKKILSKLDFKRILPTVGIIGALAIGIGFYRKGQREKIERRIYDAVWQALNSRESESAEIRDVNGDGIEDVVVNYRGVRNREDFFLIDNQAFPIFKKDIFFSFEGGYLREGKIKKTIIDRVIERLDKEYREIREE